MQATKSVLSLDFVDYRGKNVSIKLSDPREDLTAEEIENFMDLMNELKVFYILHGSKWAPAKVRGAKTIDTVTNDLDITVI